MNNEKMPMQQKQECPYYVYLTHKLRCELERERRLRVEAEMRSKPLFVLAFVLLVSIVIGSIFYMAFGNWDTEVLNACIYLARACAALFFSLTLAFLAVNYTLDCHAKRKQKKGTADKKEE